MLLMREPFSALDVRRRLGCDAELFAYDDDTRTFALALLKA